MIIDTPTINAAEIGRRSGYPSDWIEFLVRGSKQRDLDDFIASNSNLEPGSSAAATARMNFVGTLRSWGYTVTGGKKPPKDFYQLVGYEEPQARPSPLDVSGPHRETLEWLARQPQVILDSRATINTQLAENSNEYHENSFGYIWSYELARDQGYLVEWRGELCLVIWRFKYSPRLRLFYLKNRVDTLLSLAEHLAPASRKPIPILNVPRDQIDRCKRREPLGTISKRVEAVVDVEEVLDNLEKHFNKRGLTTLRKAEREIEYRSLNEDTVQDAERVLQLWREVNESKHRQLAHTRDLTAFRACTIYSYRRVGYRGSNPVSTIVCDRLPNRPEIATLIVEKSLNYSTVSGGKYGTADANMCTAMADLRRLGISVFNLGGYDGGGWGLPAHKAHYADRADDVVSLAFYTPYLHFGQQEV